MKGAIALKHIPKNSRLAYLQISEFNRSSSPTTKLLRLKIFSSQNNR